MCGRIPCDLRAIGRYTTPSAPQTEAAIAADSLSAARAVGGGMAIDRGSMITSTSNPQVKQLQLLQKKAKERELQDVFVVEGIKMYREAPKDRLIHTYVSESFLRKNPSVFEGVDPLTELSDRAFESVSDTKTPQGVLCLVRRRRYALNDLLEGRSPDTISENISETADNQRNAAGAPLIMILENLQDPGNLGTILRTAEGAGVTGIMLSRDCVDIYNPKVIRSTMGSVYRVPFCYSQDWQGDLDRLKRRGVRLYAAHLKGEKFYDEISYRGSSAFLIGNESRGLTQETAELADAYIRIPMCGQVESLNAAVSASVLMYEANRQRRG